MDFTDVQWVWHAGILYSFAEPTDVHLDLTHQTGDWHRINSSRPDSVVSGDIFLLWMSHDVDTSSEQYAYAVTPRFDQGKLSTSNLFPAIVRTNSTFRQAVQDGHVLGYVSYQASEQNTPHLGLFVDDERWISVHWE